MKSISTGFANFLGLIVVFSTLQVFGAQITVLSEAGQPVIGADVLIGPSEGVPFVDNKLKTDLNGQAAIPTEWVSTQPVTVLAGGYRMATFLNVEPLDVTFQIHREDSKNIMQVSGETTNYDNLRKDGKVDFTLVYPALRKHQLSQIDVSSMISPEVDILSVMGESMAVPSNLSLPEQKENYVLPITLSKPVYRIGFKQTGDYRMTGLHGQFPIRQVVGDIRDGKAFYEVINYFRIVGGGQRDVVVNQSLTGQDVPINQLTVDKKMTVRGPALGADIVMFSMALAGSNNMYYPTDIKRISAGQNMELVVPSRSDETSFISMIMTKADADQIGGGGTQSAKRSPLAPVLKHFYNEFLNVFRITHFDELHMLLGGNQTAGGVSIVRHPETLSTPDFLNLIPRPSISGNKLIFTPPQVSASVTPVATFIVLSEIEYRNTGKYTLENKYRLWEISESGWATEVNLPQMPVNLTPGKKYRWEVLFMGQQNGQNQDSGEYFLNAVTHVTRNSIDF